MSVGSLATYRWRFLVSRYRVRNNETVRFDETLRMLVQQYRGVLGSIEQLQTRLATLEVELPYGIKDFAPGG
jgi:hypothetical protein